MFKYTYFFPLFVIKTFPFFETSQENKINANYIDPNDTACVLNKISPYTLSFLFQLQQA